MVLSCLFVEMKFKQWVIQENLACKCDQLTVAFVAIKSTSSCMYTWVNT